MYADFEAMLVDKKEGDVSSTYLKKDEATSVEPKKKIKKETIYQEHQVISYAFKIVSIDPDYNEPIEIYRGIDSVERFLTSAQEKAREIYNKYIAKPKPQPKLTPE